MSFPTSAPQVAQSGSDTALHRQHQPAPNANPQQEMAHVSHGSRATEISIQVSRKGNETEHHQPEAEAKVAVAIRVVAPGSQVGDYAVSKVKRLGKPFRRNE